ncbi:O-antigen ligase family protein [Vibrio splendidus]
MIKKCDHILYLLATLIAFIFIFNPSLKFLYRSELVNVIPTIIFSGLLVVYFNRIIKGVSIRFTTPLVLIYLFFFGQFFSMLDSLYVDYFDLVKLINLLISFVIGFIICDYVDKKLLGRIAITWCVLLCVGHYFGVITFGYGEDFNHLNFTLPLATVSSGIMVDLIIKGGKLNIKSVINCFVLVLLLFNIFTAGSRAAILLPFICAFVCVALFYKHVSMKKIILLFFSIALMLFLSWDLIISNMSDFFIHKMFERSVESDGRYSLYLDSIHIISDNPFGVWFNGFSKYITQPYPHNIFLEIAYNSGVFFGIVFFMIVTLVILMYKQKTLFVDNEKFFVWFVYLMFAWNFSNGFLSSSPIFFLLGLLIAKEQKTIKKEH